MEKEQNRLHPTTLGMTVTDLLTEYFTTVMDIDFTAKIEEELDEVSRGDRDWVPMLREFFGPFEKALGSIQDRTIIMPCNQDLYFRTKDNEIEANCIPNVSLRPYDSPFGHCVANPGNDKKFELELDKNISELLE